jgi:phosphoglycolate phosphatase
MAYKAVLFDMDGTLLDTLEDLAMVGNRMLEANGFPVHPLEDYRYFVGEGALKLVTKILPEANRDDETIEACLETFLEDYDRNWQEKTRPYQGVVDMLDYLQDNGYRLSILSNKPQAFTEMCVGEFLSRWQFEAVWGKREGFEHKPSPEGALRISADMGLDPAEFFYLGDTHIDMFTAGRAGMFPAGALWGFRTKEELLDSGAKALLESPMDIKKFLTTT